MVFMLLPSKKITDRVNALGLDSHCSNNVIMTLITTKIIISRDSGRDTKELNPTADDSGKNCAQGQNDQHV